MPFTSIWSKSLKALRKPTPNFRTRLSGLVKRTSYWSRNSKNTVHPKTVGTVANLHRAICPRYKKLKACALHLEKNREGSPDIKARPTEVIPPDNNASERAIRNFKIKLKVSNFFRSPAGSETYAVIRSVIDTAIKNHQNPYEATRLITILPATE